MHQVNLTVTVDDLHLEREFIIAGQSGKKNLFMIASTVTNKVTYKLTVRGKEDVHFFDLENAVEAFNDAHIRDIE